MKRKYLVDSITQEYKTKNKIEYEKFRKENCFNCKNRLTDKCEIRRNINNILNCAYREI